MAAETPVDAYELRRKLNEHRRLQAFSLAMLRDTALLAAFQAIDVRLSILEKPDRKSITVGDIIWEAAVAICLGRAGSVVEKGLTTLFESILKTRLAFSIVPKTDLGSWLQGQLSTQLKSKVISKQEFKIATDALLRDADVKLIYHEFTFKAVDPGIKAAADVKSVQETFAKLLVDEKPTDDGLGRDLATVAVLRNALAFFNRQILTQELMFDEFEVALAAGNIQMRR
jgi:hypothetical protein